MDLQNEFKSIFGKHIEYIISRYIIINDVINDVITYDYMKRNIPYVFTYLDKKTFSDIIKQFIEIINEINKLNIDETKLEKLKEIIELLNNIEKYLLKYLSF